MNMKRKETWRTKEYFFILNTVFIILRHPRQTWAAIGCTENGPANKSGCTLRSDELLSYMQGMGFNKFLMNTLYMIRWNCRNARRKQMSAVDLFENQVRTG